MRTGLNAENRCTWVWVMQTRDVAIVEGLHTFWEFPEPSECLDELCKHGNCSSAFTKHLSKHSLTTAGVFTLSLSLTLIWTRLSTNERVRCTILSYFMMLGINFVLVLVWFSRKRRQQSLVTCYYLIYFMFSESCSHPTLWIASWSYAERV